MKDDLSGSDEKVACPHMRINPKARDEPKCWVFHSRHRWFVSCKTGGT